jgi:chromatin remodeling complex protein RSC6
MARNAKKKSSRKAKPAKAKKAAKPKKSTKAKVSKKSAKSAAKPSAKAKARSKAPAKPKTKRKPNPAFMRPMQPSQQLAAVVGSEPIPRSEVVSRVWDYIRKNNLQNPQNRREILADEKLEPLFGKKNVSMFEMNKHLSRHMS